MNLIDSSGSSRDENGQSDAETGHERWRAVEKWSSPESHRRMNQQMRERSGLKATA